MASYNRSYAVDKHLAVKLREPLLDEIGKRVSASPDVWCATNTEIYDYATAYASLIFSADNSKVYNPTLKTVWFERDGVMYSVAPGETLTNLLV
jgi:hypothetical protein